MDETRIVIVDDHPMIRESIHNTLQGLRPRLNIVEAGTRNEFNAILARDKSIDLITLDLDLEFANQDEEGIEMLMHTKLDRPEIPIIMISANKDPAIVRKCLAFGASGYIFKSMTREEIRSACSAVLDGHIWSPPGLDLNFKPGKADQALLDKVRSLTPQQRRVLQMLGEGLLNKQIAYKLGVSEATIKAHVSAILTKLEVDSRTQAVIAISRLSNADFGESAA